MSRLKTEGCYCNSARVSCTGIRSRYWFEPGGARNEALDTAFYAPLVGRGNIDCGPGRSGADDLSLSVSVLMASVPRSHLCATSLQT